MLPWISSSDASKKEMTLTNAAITHMHVRFGLSPREPAPEGGEWFFNDTSKKKHMMHNVTIPTDTNIVLGNVLSQATNYSHEPYSTSDTRQQLLHSHCMDLR
jgi:hypothetical protein